MGIGTLSVFDQTPAPPVTRCVFLKTMETILSPWANRQLRTMTLTQRRSPKSDRLSFATVTLLHRPLGAGDIGSDSRLAQGNGGVAWASVAPRSLPGQQAQTNYKILPPPALSRIFSRRSLRRYPSRLGLPRTPSSSPSRQQTTSANTANRLSLKIYRTTNWPMMTRNRGPRQGHSRRTSPRASLPLTYRRYRCIRQYLGCTLSSP